MNERLEDLRGRAEGVVYTTELSLREYGHLLAPPNVKKIKGLLERLQTLLACDDAPDDGETLEAALKDLERACHDIGR